MDFTRFKPKNGERYIFIENEKPIMVLLSFDDYQKNLRNSKQESFPAFTFKPAFGGDNQQNIREDTIEKKENNEDEEDLKVEDLPF